MRLTLMNGYPFPYPDNLTEAEQAAISDAASGYEVSFSGVRHFEWLHTVTVEFYAYGAFHAARKLTGWAEWSGLILEAKLSAEDGYDHPAIVVGNMAYCGFSLTVE